MSPKAHAISYILNLLGSSVPSFVNVQYLQYTSTYTQNRKQK
jgi:hypothetical protein